MIFLTKQMINTLMALPNNEFCIQVSEASRKRIVLLQQIVAGDVDRRPQQYTFSTHHFR